MLKLSQILDANVMKICDANVMKICNENSVKYQLLIRAIDVKQHPTRNITL
jgi:hypothetical protein